MTLAVNLVRTVLSAKKELFIFSYKGKLLLAPIQNSLSLHFPVSFS